MQEIYIEDTGEIIIVNGDIPSWGSNELFTVTSLTTSPEIPDQFILHPAYPNPFNPQTTISYDLPLDSKVSVIIYDIRGDIVTELLVKDKIQKAGNHSIVWNAGDLSTGIYFIKMSINGKSKLFQKLLLIKSAQFI